MTKPVGYFLLSVLTLLTTAAFADSWIKPTPEELSMTAEPAAPGAPAIYLYREERADDKLHMHSLYVRLKVLTEKGKEYGDVEIPYEGERFAIRAVEGRTIHSDGTTIPFTGKPYEKLLDKTKTSKYKAKVFTLPDVQVGSILEYRYVISYDDQWMYSPEWIVQQPLYVRKAHYEFIPTTHLLVDQRGNGTGGGLAYYPLLPKGAEVKYSQTSNVYTLDLDNILPLPDEEYMPPMQSVTYRVLFYYSSVRSADEYWKEEGKYWSRDIDKFMDAGELGGIANRIVAPNDSPRQKVQKIYDAVMKLDNTNFTRGHTGAEDKAEGIKTKTAADIWNAKRGDPDQIDILFVGLARAAGLKAYVGAVTDRDRAFFVPGYFYMGQLDDDIAIVELDGKDEYFDPGERYCQSDQMHWKHTMAQGLRQTAKGTAIFLTPPPTYKMTSVLRNADIRVEEHGEVHGTLRITMTGSSALKWRQRLLRTDEDQIKKEFEESVQREVPEGVQVKTHHFLAATEYDNPLMAVLDISGTMGTATSKRVFLPTMFFEAGAKPLFVHDKRMLAVDLDYPYGTQDSVVLHLPPGMTIESSPKDAQIPLPKSALYQASFKPSADHLEISRVFILANAIYPAQEYGTLKDFYQKVNAKDQEQAILQPSAVAAAKHPDGGSQ